MHHTIPRKVILWGICRTQQDSQCVCFSEASRRSCEQGTTLRLRLRLCWWEVWETALSKLDTGSRKAKWSSGSFRIDLSPWLCDTRIVTFSHQNLSNCHIWVCKLLITRWGMKANGGQCKVVFGSNFQAHPWFYVSSTRGCLDSVLTPHS